MSRSLQTGFETNFFPSVSGYWLTFPRIQDERSLRPATRGDVLSSIE